MSFSLERWRGSVRAGLSGGRAKMAQLGVNSAYGYVAALTLLPVLQAAAGGEGAILELLKVAGGVGGNLLAEQLQRWQDRANASETPGELAKFLVEQAAREETLRAELERLFQQVGLMAQVQQVLSEADRLWLLATLKEELRQLRSGTYRARLDGDGAIAQGDGALAVGAHGVGVQGNVGSLIVNPPAPDPAEVALAQARAHYLARLYQRCNVLPLVELGGKKAGGEAVQLREVYIAPDTTTRIPLPEEEKQQSRNLWGNDTRPLGALEAALQHPRLALLGAPGSGKSSFVRQMAAELALACREGRALVEGWPVGLLPVLVVLRELAPRLRELALDGPRAACHQALVGALWAQWRAELEALDASGFEPGLRAALTQGEVFLIFDGLDEVAVALRERVQQAVQALVEEYPAVGRIIVTCRTRSYSGEAILPGFQTVTLAPFTEAQIRRFIASWYGTQGGKGELTVAQAEARAADLQQAALAVDLRALAENPMLLTAMALLHQQNVGLPRERVRLYAQTVRLLLERWQRQRGIEVSAALGALLHDERRLRLIMERLAYEAHRVQAAQGGEGDLSRRELLALLDEPELLGDLDIRAQDFLDYVDQRAGLLVGQGGDDGARPALYRFPHRTFQEYLAGCQMVRGRARERTSEFWARAGEGDFWYLAAQLGVEELYYERAGEQEVLDLAYVLCPEAEPRAEAAWRAVLWSGRMAALVGVEAVQRDLAQPYNDPRYLARLRARLVALLRGAILPASERAEAGRVLAALGDPRPEVMTLEGMHFCYIPPGPFWMGSPKEDEMGYDDERPLHKQEVPYGYWLGRYPVANAQYALFVQAGGYGEARYWAEAAAAGHWQEGKFQRRNGPASGLANHPVVGMSWYEALAFTRWLTEVGRHEGWLSEGWQVGLPSEMEWEKAARGGLAVPQTTEVREAGSGAWEMPPSFPLRPNEAMQRRYPWGEAPDAERANYAETQISSSSAVGAFPGGASLYGCEEMGGNVYEWTRSVWGNEYPYDATDGREDLTLPDTAPRVLRGGAFRSYERAVRCAYRSGVVPQGRDIDVGFRLAVSPAPLGSGASGL